MTVLSSSQLTALITSTVSSTVTSALPSVTTTATSTTSQDFRVRLSPLNPTEFYGATSGTNILSILQQTNGVIFPYTPQVTFSESVDYDAVSTVQTNGEFLAYTKTPSVTISIAGKFTVQNQREGQYALAAIHFFRTASKSYFGLTTPQKAGLPPAMLVLNGYGTYMFNNLNVRLKSHSYSYDENMDTVPVTVGSDVTRLPALFTISCELTVQQTPSQMTNTFDLDAFRTGALMKSGGWI